MFKDRVIIVTGSSKGIGREIALKMAEYGANVVITYCNDFHSANQTLSRIQEKGNRALCLKLDVTKEESVIGMYKEIDREFSRIDVLINNAGIGVPNSIENIDLNTWNKTIETNITGAFLCTKYALPLFKASGGGHIVNISSVAGLTGGSFGPHYGASKAGLIGLTKSCARDLAKYNINVNAIAPGPIDSDMTDSLSDEVLAKIIDGTPLGRVGKMSEVAELTCLLSNANVGFITGQTIVVDGGRYMI